MALLGMDGTAPWSLHRRGRSLSDDAGSLRKSAPGPWHIDDERRAHRKGWQGCGRRFNSWAARQSLHCRSGVFRHPNPDASVPGYLRRVEQLVLTVMAGLDPALQVSGVLPLRALEAVSSNGPLKQGHMRALEKIGLSLSPAFEEAAEVPGEVEIVGGEEVRKLPRWAQAFQGRRKDSQYFEIVEETICPEFEYGYFLVKDGAQRLIAIQPFFVLDQDLLAGVPERWLRIPRLIRRYWPGFLKLRTLMAGCAAGE